MLGHLLGCTGWISHVVNFYPKHPWQVWDLMEAGRHKDAEELFDRFMTPYNALVDAIMAETAGEGIFVRPAWRPSDSPPGCPGFPRGTWR